MTDLVYPLAATPSAGKAGALALGLLHVENALQRLTQGQVDAIVDPDGSTYLLRPAQEYLRRNEARLQSLVDAVPDVLTVLNEIGEVDYQSPAMTAVLGYDAGELLGQSIFGYIHPDDFPRFREAFFETMRKILPLATIEFRHRARDGTWRSLEATLGALQPVETLGVVLTFRDATGRDLARKESAQREVEGAEAALAKDRFLAMLSHELRTPLMPALLGIAALQEDERFAEARATLTMIHRNITLQTRLIEELIDFTAIGQHKMRLHLESVDVHAAIRFVLEICQAEISAARIEVQLDLQATDYLVLADSLRLQQVMWNLVKNAVKFSTPGSSISIDSANDSSGRLTLEFADHGIGIEQELLGLVFEPFQQGSLSMQTIYGGLGLGMFIAKGLVEAQHGTLTVRSEGRGHGATFSLSFETAPPNPD